MNFVITFDIQFFIQWFCGGSVYDFDTALCLSLGVVFSVIKTSDSFGCYIGLQLASKWLFTFVCLKLLVCFWMWL